MWFGRKKPRGPALSQLFPIGPRAQLYRPWCKLTGNLGSGVTDSLLLFYYYFLFIFWGRQTFVWGGGGGGGIRGRHRNYLFPHHIYCAQSKVKWGSNGMNGRASPPPPPPPHSYATEPGPTEIVPSWAPHLLR